MLYLTVGGSRVRVDCLVCAGRRVFARFTSLRRKSVGTRGPAPVRLGSVVVVA